MVFKIAHFVELNRSYQPAKFHWPNLSGSNFTRGGGKSKSPVLTALRSSRQEATGEQGKLIAVHMKVFLRYGGRSHRFSVVNTFAEMNELHHN